MTPWPYPRRILLFLFFLVALRAQGQGPMSLSIQVTDGYCGNINGMIVVIVSGGTPPYAYDYGFGDFKASARFIVAGGYNIPVSVKDATGQVISQTVYVGNVGDPPDGVHSIMTYPSACNALDGTLTIVASGGTPPYQYSMDLVNWQNSPVFSGLGNGIYNFFIRGADGCVSRGNAYRSDICGYLYNGAIPAYACGNSASGYIGWFSAAGHDYSYSLNGAAWEASGAFSGLAPGVYHMRIRDNVSGEMFLYSWNIVKDCAIQVTGVVTDANCGSKGQIVASASLGNGGYQYSLDGLNFQGSGQFTGLDAGVYTVWARDQLGNYQSTMTEILDNCPIAVSATSTAEHCNSKDGSIEASGAGGTTPYTYSLDGVNFQVAPNFAGLAAGNYTITIHDAGGNSNTTVVTVGEIAGPTMSLDIVPASCLGGPDGSVTINANGGTLPYQYALDGGDYGVSAAIAAYSGNHVASVMDAAGCVSSQGVVVGLNNNMTAALAVSDPICQGEGVQLAATVNWYLSYTWSPATGLDRTDVLNPVASPAETTTYTLTTVYGICSQSASTTVVVHPAPVADAGADEAICKGGTTVLHGSGGVQYEWQPAQYLSDAHVSDPSVTPLSTISYQLWVTDDNGCRSVQPSTVTIKVEEPSAISIGNDTSVLSGQPVPMVVTGVDADLIQSVSWTPATGLDDPGSAVTVARPTESVDYSVALALYGGCQTAASRHIAVFSVAGIFVPNAFSPNGDGHNDLLRVRMVGMRELRYFTVFNRWGQRVFMTANADGGWDGRIGGRPAESGSYVWMAAGIDLRGMLVEKKGTVVLVR